MNDARSLFVRLFALDLRSIAAYRIALGATLLIDLVTRAFHLRAHYTDAGVLPRAVAFELQGTSARWSIHLATGTTQGQALLFLVAAIAAVCLLVGWRPRVFAVISWLLLISLQNRNPPLSYGFDLLLRVCLMWSCFLPLGARFSVDDRLRARRTPDHAPAADTHASAATLALTLQMAFVYVFSGLQKLGDPSWRELTAVFFGVTTDHHTTSLARLLAGQPVICEVLTVVILALELLLPVLLFIPAPASGSSRTRDLARLWAAFAFALFHLGTASLFKIGLFPLVGVVAWIAFLPSSVWEARVPSRRGLDVDTRPAASAVIAALLVFVLAFNLESVTDSRLLRGNPRAFAWALRLDQTWNMFVHPMTDGWFVARARLVDGTQVDLLKDGAPVDFAKPASVSSTFPDMRWRKYVTMLLRTSGQAHRAPYLEYLCATWNRDAGNAPGQRARRIDLVFMNEKEHPNGAPPRVKRTVLSSVQCRLPASPEKAQGTRL